MKAAASFDALQSPYMPPLHHVLGTTPYAFAFHRACEARLARIFKDLPKLFDSHFYRHEDLSDILVPHSSLCRRGHGSSVSVHLASRASFTLQQQYFGPGPKVGEDQIICVVYD